VAKKLLYVRVTGTAYNQTFGVVSHELRGLPAGTYHIFEMADGTTVFLNDFGIRSVSIADSPEKLN